MGEVGHDLVERHDAAPGRWRTNGQTRRRRQTAPDPVGNDGIQRTSRSRRPRRAKLGHHPVPIGDEYRLARSRQPDILAETILELPDPDRTHASNVAACGHDANFRDATLLQEPGQFVESLQDPCRSRLDQFRGRVVAPADADRHRIRRAGHQDVVGGVANQHGGGARDA